MTEVLAILICVVYFLIFMMGTAIFSFLNVVIYRVPKQLNFVKGASFCPSCGHELRLCDMVPVFSYIFLRGKCRYCKTHIPVRDTLTEILGGILAVATVLRFGSPEGIIGASSNSAAIAAEGISTGAAAVSTDIFDYAAGVLTGAGGTSALLRILTVFAYLCVLEIVAFVDHDTMEIPNGFIIAMLVVAVVSFFTFPEITIPERLIGFVCTSGPLFLITLAIPGAFGGGDIKLLAACGLFLGWKLSLVALFLGILTGGIWGIVLLASKKAGRKDHFAFGPFLCFGLAFAAFFGTALIAWYMGFAFPA